MSPSSKIIHQDELPLSNIAREFVGEQHDASVTFRLGDEERVVHAGEMVLVAAGQPHAFVNTGAGPLRQIDIHASPSFSTEWLEDGSP